MRLWNKTGNVKCSTIATVKMIAAVVTHPIPQHRIRLSRLDKFLGNPQSHIYLQLVEFQQKDPSQHHWL